MSQQDNRRFSLRSSIADWRSLFDNCSFFWRRSESRSRRKQDKKPANSSKKPAGSFSQACQKVSKKASADLGVCGSLDDNMLDMLTRLPQGMDTNEWLATHMLALFDHVNSLCGTIGTELCTPVSCPIMSYPGNSKAHWIDDKGKRQQYSAMQYIDCVMSYCEKSRKNEILFPTKYGNSFSSELEIHCKRSMKLLWHCIGHLYTKHWDQMAMLNLRPQVAVVLAHMQRIAKEYSLMDSKDFSTMSHTVQLVRNAQLRSHGDHDHTDGSAPLGRHSRAPSSKSGSWGGHPTPGVLMSKPVAQTC
ncbi:hypothetical protein L596_003979 [Steinernema carpocapsae]|uniref:Mob1/phocein family protein n=1 Tax=Steinernema carpocapsae TaxID=34508 RepID=A0A4U8UVC4_STECR|nr:hypothetical protein L596_003979 [Steinernema carpocapsae]